MRVRGFAICLLLVISTRWAEEKITPHKFDDELPSYEIPLSSRFVIKRGGDEDTDIIFYRSLPEKESYPIAILCGGSSDKDHISSIIHFHRYFLEECINIGVAVITVEQWGVNGSQIDEAEFIAHYTRTQRLQDHRSVIKHLKSNPIDGWNGKFVFIGVSEGGPLVTSLSIEYAEDTVATINWSGAGDWSWREELWAFLQHLIEVNPECSHSLPLSECVTCSELITTRKNYDALMNLTLETPTSKEYFLNMSYLYHADALVYPSCHYKALSRPFLVLDTTIDSCDEFIAKARAVGAPVTYMRVPDMDHYVRKRPDIIEESFEWLQNQIGGYFKGGEHHEPNGA